MRLGRRVRITVAAAFALIVGLGGLVAPAATAAGTGVISGTVTAENPIGWDGLTQVILHPVGGGTIRTFNTTSSGAYQFTLPVGTAWTVEFSYRGTGNFLSEYNSPTGTSNGAIQYPITEGSIAVVDASLATGGSISGALAGSNGPLPSATITVYGGGALTRARPVFNATTGTYLIDRLGTANYQVKFESETDWKSEYWENGNGVGTSIPVTAGNALTGYDVVLDAVTVITGKITGIIDGAPIRSATATLYRDGSQLQTYNTGPTGAFKFANIGSGTFTVCFSNDYEPEEPGYPKAYQWIPECYGGPTQATAIPIVLTQGQRADNIDGALSRNGSITGTITVMSTDVPSPIMNGRALLWQEDEAGSGYYTIIDEFITGADGRFWFDDLNPGRYIVRADDGDFNVFGSQFYPNSRYFSGAVPIEVDVDADANLDPFRLIVQRFDMARLSGPSRFETGVAITRATFPGAASESDHPDFDVPVVYIANGLNFPDALAAGPAAIAQGGALLLVSPAAIPLSVQTELERLEPEKIVVVGGLPSVGAEVYADLADFVDDPDENLVRLSGASRYETAANVVEYAFGDLDPDFMFVATGQNFPDALAAGPAAGQLGGPVILVDGTLGYLPQRTKDLIEGLGITTAFIAGGTGTVSPGIEASLFSLIGSFGTPTVHRLGGNDRYETAFYINSVFQYETENAFLAVGTGFADALAGGPLAGALGSPLYLSNQNCVPEYVIQDLVYLNVQRVTLLGGTPSLSANVENLVPCGLTGAVAERVRIVE